MKDALTLLKEQDDLGTELTNAMELIHKKNERIKNLEEQLEAITKRRMNAGAFD
jgi:restriction endonuclease S subunit